MCVCVCVFMTQSDLDESASALKSATEQAKRSANDVAHLSEDLRQQQDRNAALEKQRRLQEAQIKELQVRQRRRNNNNNNTISQQVILLEDIYDASRPTSGNDIRDFSFHEREFPVYYA